MRPRASQETKPDLVIVGIGEPIARAIQTIQGVRSSLPDTPIIAYSASTDIAIVRQVMHVGVKDLLAAPVKPGELLGAIDQVMRGIELGAVTGFEAKPAQKTSAGTVLTVFGAKGGIGKTTIAVNVAAAIAKNTDNSVLVIDLDTRFGDVAIMLDIEPRFTVAQLAATAHTLERDTFKAALVKHDSGIYVLPSPKHPNEWRSVEAADIKELIRFAARMFDYVILDTPGAFNDIVGTALEAATQVLVVTSVDMASIKDTSFILDLLESESFPSDRLMLTVNHANGANTIRAADIQRVLHHDVFWEIPHDSEVTLATQFGKPVVLAKPKSRAAVNLTQLAEKIAGKPQPVKQERKSLIRRLVPVGARN